MSNEPNSSEESAPTTADPKAAKSGYSETQKIRGWQRAAIWPLGVIARAWMSTLRFEVTEETLHAMQKNDVPIAFIVWHNRLFLVGEIFKRFRNKRPLYALVSASKDGAWLAAFFELIGIKSVRGSSSHNARESVGLLVNVMQSGRDIGITPDGPRGPMYDFKGGGMIVARRARATVLLVGAEFEKAWQLKSWDRFYLPHPFSRVRLHCRIVTPEEIGSRATTLEGMGQRMRDLNPDSKPMAARKADTIVI